MEAGILKIGTMPLGHYFIRGNKKLSDYAVNDKIVFREQKIPGIWERGIIKEIIIDIPRIERM